MAFRLGGHITYLEMRNRHYTTWGVFVIRGREDHPVSFQLTGTPSPDLVGKTIRFEPMAWPDQSTPREARKATKGFNHLQVGVTGDITTESWVRIFDVPMGEVMKAYAKKAGMPPTRWVRRAYFEWYSQNGRVVIECPVELVEEEVGEDNWQPLPISLLPPHHPDRTREELEAPSVLEVSCISQDGSVEQMTFIPGNDPVEAAEFMDRLIDSTEMAPAASLFGEPRHLPDPETLDEKQAEVVFKSILVELAMRGVAVHVCDHYSPREAYRLLVSRILHETEIHPEAAGKGWVQGLSTHDFCPQCEAEMEAKFKDYKFEGDNRPVAEPDEPPVDEP